MTETNAKSKRGSTMERAVSLLERHPRLAALAEPMIRKIPLVQNMIEGETTSLLEELEPALKPYRQTLKTHARLPEHGLERKQILRDLRTIHSRESKRWEDGFVSGGVYNGDRAHIDFLNRVYAINSQSNPLHAEVFPGTIKFEAEIISMTANLLSGGKAGEHEICGSLVSGGTEGILMAMKAYRDYARAERGIRHPEIVAPVTAHAAFDKAAEYFGMRIRRIPLDHDFRANIEALPHLVSRNTVVIVGSAPNFPHGIIDPIREMSEFARSRGIGFHSDACLGGFILPFAERLGAPVPPFDFRLPGVTSMTADTHKYGYAAKGTSVVLYRGTKLRSHQFFTATDWPGGLYFSPTMAGSRPGALSAAAWAALLSTGEKGYLDATRKILKTAEQIREGIGAIDGLRVLGRPLFIIAFTSDELDIYRVLDSMTGKGWSLNGLHRPPCIHIALTLRHTRPGVAKRFLTDLRRSVEEVRSTPGDRGDMAPLYGMAGTIPVRSVVRDLLKKYIEVLYRV